MENQEQSLFMRTLVDMSWPHNMPETRLQLLDLWKKFDDCVEVEMFSGEEEESEPYHVFSNFYVHEGFEYVLPAYCK